VLGACLTFHPRRCIRFLIGVLPSLGRVLINPVLEKAAAFDEAWLTLKSVGNKTVKPDELARAVLRLAMEGERDPARLHDEALKGMLPATTRREAS
jgi:hypothetical protein